MNAHWTEIGLGFVAAVALVQAGCGQGGATPTQTPTAQTIPPKGEAVVKSVPAATKPDSLKTVKAAADSGTIVGWVGYQGPLPKPRPINFGGEKACANLNRDKTPVDESVVLNPNGTLKWAVVGIRGNVPGEHRPPPDKPVIVDQIGCIFVPHVTALMVGQEIEFRNSDPVSHNIRGTPRRNTSFNSIFAANMSTKLKLDTPEVGIPLKCDIHFWMSSYLNVFPHPFFAVTGDDGSFVIKGVPAGTYTLQVWHEKFKQQTETVEVKAGEVREVPFTLSSGG
jgi:hypothetical protein